MILTIDVGNTQIAGGVFDDEKLILSFRKGTPVATSSDEIGLFLKSVLRENGINPEKIQRIGCSSVVPSINHSLANAGIKYFKKEILFIQAGIKTGLKIKYANPKEIGADRIAGAIGALSQVQNKNLIIIDMGTATTVDLITKNNEYLGGAILPGIRISMEALSTKTAKLPTVEIKKPEHVYGNSTIEAIQAGLYYGNAGALKEFCSLFKKNVFCNEDSFVIGTGGFSRIYEDYKIFDIIVPELIFLGIKKTLELNPEL